jgi:protein-S-isoprenylcysteine O-methyltransferase Ste14
MGAAAGGLFAIIWIAWLASWMAAAPWSAATQKRAASWQSRAYPAIMFVGAALMASFAIPAMRRAPLWHVSNAGGYALAAVTLAGIAMMWWARIYLGRLWSSAITRKEGHRLIDTGPYAYVRHPIYTGLIAALIATAGAQATLGALAGAALVIFGVWLKAQAEERFLADELGADVYGDYRRRVPMLVPFLPRR